MADVAKKDNKVVGVVKEFLPNSKKQVIGTSVITVGVSALSFVIGRLTKGTAKKESIVKKD